MGIQICFLRKEFIWSCPRGKVNSGTIFLHFHFTNSQGGIYRLMQVHCHIGHIYILGICWMLKVVALTLVNRLKIQTAYVISSSNHCDDKNIYSNIILQAWGIRHKDHQLLQTPRWQHIFISLLPTQSFPESSGGYRVGVRIVVVNLNLSLCH